MSETPKGISIDEKLIRIDRATDEQWTREGEAFCLSEVWNADPQTPEGVEAKEKLLDEIAPQDDSGGYRCPAEGCLNTSYQKNPDYKEEEDTERHGRVFRPVDPKRCSLIDFCLQDAFEVGSDIESKPLKQAVQRGAYDYIKEETDKVAGARLVNGNRCVAEGCTLSAGFSEDGCGGTAGQCIKKLVLLEQAADTDQPATE